MSYGAQVGIPEDVLNCVKRIHGRISDSRYKGQEHEILSRAVETSENILHTYQAYEGNSLHDQLFLLDIYAKWIRESISMRYNLRGILLQLRALVKIFKPEEKKKSPPGKNEELEKLQSKIDKLEKNLHEERVAKDDLYQRLSKVAADRMKTGNPEIADLSDPNRPMKLAEKFNELYSSAWSDAYEWLQKNENNSSSNSTSNNSAQQPRSKPDSKKEDEDTTQILFEALKSCYEWSLKAADCQRGAIIKAGIGNIDFDTNQTNSAGDQQRRSSGQKPSSRAGNQGFGSSMTSSLHDKTQTSRGDSQTPSPREFQSSRAGNQGFGSSMTSSPHDKTQTSRGDSQTPSPHEFQSSRAGNQGFGSSMTSSPHDKTQTSRGDSQTPSPHEFQSSRAGNQGFGSSMTSSPHDKTQTSRGDSQTPSPHEFQSSRAGNQGFGSSMTSSPHDKTQTSRGDSQTPSPHEFQSSRAGNQGFGSSMTSSPHDKTQTSRGDSQTPSPHEFQSSRAGNQGFGSSMTSSPHDKTQTSRGDSQTPSPHEFQSSRAGNQGFGSSMTSSPHDKTQTSRGDSQTPYPHEFQSSRAGNQGFGSSMTSSPHDKTQTSRGDSQTPYPHEFQSSRAGNQGFGSSMTSSPHDKTQAGGENASVNQVDKAKAKEEEKESAALDSPAKEFMRCAGVESAKRLPEKICQKVMEDKTYHDIEVYVQKCAELCWLMRIQFPPIELLFDIKPNGDFNHKLHKPYTSSGEKIAFPVWPTMLLHKDGPVLSMGVVQCKKN